MNHSSALLVKKEAPGNSNAGIDSDSNVDMVGIGAATGRFGETAHRKLVYVKASRKQGLNGRYRIFGVVCFSLGRPFLSQLGAGTLPRSVFLRASVFPSPALQ